MKEKIILAVGNVEGVGGVEDKAGSGVGGRESRFHTVESGDTLSAISKTYYGTWRLYPEIFEANKPMLSHPDKIYPGQVAFFVSNSLSTVILGLDPRTHEPKTKLCLFQRYIS